MAPELQAYYEERFNLFSTVGWKHLIEDVTDMVNALDQVQNIKTFEDLRYKQGQLDILNWIITLKKVSEEAYDELVLEDK